MLDIKWIRENPELLDKALQSRGVLPCSSKLIELDRRKRSFKSTLQNLQTRRNEFSKKIGQLKADGKNAEDLITEVGQIRERLQLLQNEEKKVSEELNKDLSTLPNIPADDVPAGKNDNDNLELRRIGKPRSFSFEPRDHVVIGENLNSMDFERAARLSGSRFVILTGALARLERALANFMLDIHTGEYGYKEVAVPVLVKDNAVYGTGQLPKFTEDLFLTKNGFWLIPTAEVPLTNMVNSEILSEEKLPIRVVALTNCFRSEAGAAGVDTRGMLRQHQFNKVELVSIVHPDKSEVELERMTLAAESILERLELPYRTVLLSSGDMGFSAKKTHDIEVWLPGQSRYREISSCSTCGDFQARRMNARFKSEKQKGTQFVHTLNGSGVAVGRALIAVIENYQNADNSISIPRVLQPYMGGMEEIGLNAG